MMMINQEVLEAFLSMPRYCKDDLRRIHPGWGYVGPVIRGSLTISSLDMDHNDFSKKDQIEKFELKEPLNWLNAKNPQEFGKMVLGGDLPRYRQQRTYFPAWIPSNFNSLLKDCNRIINETGYEITNVIMDKSVKNIGEVTVGFELDEEIQCVGTGLSFLASGLNFYKKAWWFNYEFHRPSISDINSEVYITNNYNGEPTMEFENVWNYRTEILNNAKFFKYGELKEYKTNSDIDSNPYLGTLTFMEGKFHLIWKNGLYYERLLL